MKISIIVLLLLGYSFSHADLEEVNDSSLVKEFYNGKSFKNGKYIPDGYELTADAKGDLDGDKIDDLAIIVHKRPKGKKDDEVQTSFDLQYDLRQYVILLKGSKSGDWKTWKIGESHFLNTMPNLMSENGFASMSISKGVLTIVSDFAMSMGGWGAGGCSQKWRQSKAGFQLIGITVDESDRRCGCGTKTDTNLLTGKSIVTSDKDEDGSQATKMKTRTIKEKPYVVLWENFGYDKHCSTE